MKKKLHNFPRLINSEIFIRLEAEVFAANGFFVRLLPKVDI